MATLDDDIDTMLTGLDSVGVVFGAYTGRGLRDEWDEEVLRATENGVIAERMALLLKTSAFPGLLTGSVLIVDGVAYAVLNRGRPADSADGRLTLVYVKRSTQ